MYKNLMKILGTLKAEAELEKEKEELRKKYENYKKLFVNEQVEKNSKAKELELLKKDPQFKTTEVQQLHSKLEAFRMQLEKERGMRKEKEGKLEAANQEVQKKTQSLEDLYVQIDQLYESNATREEEISKVKAELSKLKVENEQAQSKLIAANFAQIKNDGEQLERLVKIDALEKKLASENEARKLAESELSLYNSQKQNLGEAKKALDEQEQRLRTQRETMVQTLESKQREREIQQKLVNQFKSQLAESQSMCQKAEADLKESRQRLLEASQSKGGSFKDEKIEYLQHQIAQLEKWIKCSTCHENNKDCVLTTCGHVFCHKCIEKQVQLRNRKCPLCRATFTNNEHKRVHFDDMAE